MSKLDTMTWDIVGDPATCAPAQVLDTLLRAGKLAGFLASVRPDKVGGGWGNCHEACCEIMKALHREGVTGWHWLTAQVRPDGKPLRKPGRPAPLPSDALRLGDDDHSWLESDGWAIDCGRGGTVLFRRVADYHRLMQPRRIRHWERHAQKEAAA
jgi:hypothetical protein